MFTASGLEFVPNNYAAPLANENAPEAFHLIQDFLSNSDVGTALTAPLKLSASQIRTLWQTGTYDNGGESGSPSIIFEFQGEEFIVTPTTVRDALGLEDFNAFTISVGDSELIRMMREIGYSGPLTKIGQLKRPFLHKEWSFFFDCITRAFGKKCTNWDAIPTDSLQIGYSLLYGGNFDVARLVLTNIGEKMLENRNVVYFSRFCQLLFNFCCPDVEILEDDVILSFKLHKRIFSDLTNKDNKKGDVGVLMLPESKKTKLRAVKSARVNPSNAETGVSNTDDMPQKKKLKKRRANRAKSDAVDEESETDDETLHQRKRRLVAAHLFGAENVSSKVAEAPEVFVQEDAENVEAVSVSDMANAETEAEVFAQDFNADFEIENVLEAHPAVSVCDTEDVAAGQATLVLEESMATHTEILSVTNQIPELGEEVDQAAKSVSSEQIVENVEKAEVVPAVVVEKILNEATGENCVEAEVFPTNSESLKVPVEDNDELLLEALQQSVVEVVHREAELVATLNSETPEAVQQVIPDAEENQEDNAANSDDSKDAHSNPDIQVELSEDVDSDTVREANRANAEYFQDMYFKNWANADCVFSAQRAADFVNQSIKTISSSDVLTSLKATVIQIKSLHNRFDEPHKEVTALRNEVGMRDLTLKNDRSYYNSVFKKQAKDSDEIQKRLGKGESVPSDKCKDTQTLRRRDDGNDGGSKGDGKSLRLNSDRRPPRSNSDRRSNSGKGNANSASGSKLKSLIISDKPTTDEEIATKMFLEEHGGEVTVEDYDAELRMINEEHQKKMEAGTYTKKGKAPRRKEIGISIKDNVNSDQSLQYSRRPTIARNDKGKGKLEEEGQLPKKNDSTSDKAQVVQTQLKGFLRPVLSETLTLEPVDFSQTRTVHGKQSYDKSGLGSHREKRINNSPMDQTSLAEPGVGVTQESLDKLESVQLIYHKGLRKDFLLYFMADGRVYRIGENDIHLKMAEELEYVLYLLKVRNQRTQNAAEVLRVRMMRAKVLSSTKITSAYIPKYKDAHGNLVEMRRNSAKLSTALGIKVLEFNLESDKAFIIRLGNDMRRNNIYSLRAAIYQTGESDPELKELKEIMIAELERAERRLLTDYIRTVPDIEEIK
ncbi:hypothetical protein POM88_049005 [Heracleum sosnowskyi]|uniref:Uncharacterized protein n=1 Tax=Heracleum sosnowskyi TaxID=360622 RepID=A0AAD8GW86_9APIA|nr:hypothetical protein POM88_049005 [Heracleum sosnowskyi]